MKFWINLAIFLLIVVVIGNTVKRIQDNQHAQEIADAQTASVPTEPTELAQLTEEQQDLIRQANTIAPDFTPVPTLPGTPSQIVRGKALYAYACYLPHGYEDKDNLEKQYPLIIYLHGQEGKGFNLDRLCQQSPIRELQMREDPNFLVVAPLSPPNSGWMSPALNEFLDQIQERFRVDADRIYLTGISMGGHGTWRWAQDSPKRFAAIAPLCGSGNPKKAKLRLKHMPIWIFHGAQDNIVPVDRAYAMIQTLQSYGHVQYSIFPDQGHSIGSVYQNPALYIWFLTHSKDPKKSILYREPEMVSSATDTPSTKP